MNFKPTLQKNFLLLFLMQSFLLPVAANATEPMAWRIRDIASAPVDVVQLRDKRDRVIHSMERNNYC